MKNSIVILAFLLISYSICAVGWDKVSGVGKVSQKGAATAEALWLKDKDDKYDINMKLTNDAAGAILLFVGDMKCSRGADTGGTIDIHSDRRTIDLRPQESRIILMTCHLTPKNKIKGDFSINFKVFDNPTSDSNTPGKVLAQNMVWKQGEHEGQKLK